MNYRHALVIFVFGLIVGVLATRLPRIVGSVLAAASKTASSGVPGGFIDNISGISDLQIDFSYHDLRGFNFSKTHFFPPYGIVDGGFTGCNLSNANFTNAEIEPEVKFYNANLSGARFTGATFYGDGTTFWKNTICPDRTNSDNNGGSCFGHGISFQ